MSKGAMFALLLRYFLATGSAGQSVLWVTLGVLAVASMLIGNLLALLQDNVKRILAYSSIAHLGYLLVTLLAGGAMAVEAVTFYLVAYLVMTLGAFGVVTLLSPPDRDGDLDTLDDYRGLFWRRPWVAGVFMAMLLSLAGIPLTAGFVGKFHLFTAGVGGALWTLVMVLVIGSIIRVVLLPARDCRHGRAARTRARGRATGRRARGRCGPGGAHGYPRMVGGVPGASDNADPHDVGWIRVTDSARNCPNISWPLVGRVERGEARHSVRDDGSVAVDTRLNLDLEL